MLATMYTDNSAPNRTDCRGRGSNKKKVHSLVASVTLPDYYRDVKPTLPPVGHSNDKLGSLEATPWMSTGDTCQKSRSSDRRSTGGQARASYSSCVDHACVTLRPFELT